jgi:hypothetical protein
LLVAVAALDVPAELVVLAAERLAMAVQAIMLGQVQLNRLVDQTLMVVLARRYKVEPHQAAMLVITAVVAVVAVATMVVAQALMATVHLVTQVVAVDLGIIMPHR